MGRAVELAALARAFHQARSGRRQLVFVTGEPGIGKSSLADAFLEQLRLARTAQIAHGQCLDHHGVGEPYLPLIEALTRLAGTPDGSAVKRVLAGHTRRAGSRKCLRLWTRSERTALQARGRPTRERMLRELTGAVEALAADLPLVVKLEDIHWSDASTLDWLAHVARRPEHARLMVVATFRTASAAGSPSVGTLLAELALHDQCEEIALPSARSQRRRNLSADAPGKWSGAGTRDGAGAAGALRRQPALHDKHRPPTGAAGGRDVGCRRFWSPTTCAALSIGRSTISRRATM